MSRLQVKKLTAGVPLSPFHVNSTGKIGWPLLPAACRVVAGLSRPEEWTRNLVAAVTSYPPPFAPHFAALILANGKDYASLRGSGDPLDVQIEATINNAVRGIGYRYVNLEEFQRFAPFRFINGDPIAQLTASLSGQSINGQKISVMVRGGKMPVAKTEPTSSQPPDSRLTMILWPGSKPLRIEGSR